MTVRPHDEILAEIQAKKIRFVELQFTDIMGAVKSITIPVNELEATLDHGIWFDGSSIEGFARIAESDMFLKPDTATFAVIPWLSGKDATARFICDVYTPHNTPFLGDPRQVLKRVLEDADKMGFIYNTGPELEFFLLVPDED